MSLRDELQPVRTGVKSKIDSWVHAKDETFQVEFDELIQDRSIGHTQLLNLAKLHGLNIGAGAFTEWRKKQWASKTN